MLTSRRAGVINIAGAASVAKVDGVISGGTKAVFISWNRSLGRVVFAF